MQIYQFEDELEKAVATILLKNGINDVTKQRDYKIKLEDGTVRTLKTPRVEPKYLCEGLNTLEHYYLVGTTKWLDFAVGTLYLKVITRRDIAEPSHAYLRGLCRYLMQFATAITGAMKYHQIEKIIETQSTTTFEADKLHDVSALTFRTTLRVRGEWFPTS